MDRGSAAPGGPCCLQMTLGSLCAGCPCFFPSVVWVRECLLLCHLFCAHSLAVSYCTIPVSLFCKGCFSFCPAFHPISFFLSCLPSVSFCSVCPPFRASIPLRCPGPLEQSRHP